MFNGFIKYRQNMISEELISRGITDQKLLKVFAKVPRENFVLPDTKSQAYYDGALGIGFGQTISQPYMIAKTLEILKLNNKDKVLEIGTGSGYQTALLAELVTEVITVEIVPELVSFAKKNLSAFSYNNITFVTGDGTQGYIQAAPYSAIVVSAAAREIPEKLKAQLAEGGRMAIPLNSGYNQILTLVNNHHNKFTEKYFDACIFVPLIGKY